MKNNKGFTLIELLAVIVILAIIALIATPIVLGIIDDARNGAKDSTAQMIIDNVELAYSTAYIKNNGVTPTLEQVADAFKMDGVRWDKDNESGELAITVESKHAVCTYKAEGELEVTCTPDYEGATAVSTNADNGMTLTATEAEPTTPGTDTTEPGTENTDPAQGA